MKLDIIDVIEKNEFFLKKIFPEGINDSLKLGRVNLFFENKIDFSIYTNCKPLIEQKKWGIWNKNYNTIVLKLSGHFLKNIEIKNWQNNNMNKCSVNIEKKDDVINLQFNGIDWSANFELESILHQETSVYIDETFNLL